VIHVFWRIHGSPHCRAIYQEQARPNPQGIYDFLQPRKDREKCKSPLEDIKGIKAKTTMADILDAIREGRERN